MPLSFPPKCLHLLWIATLRVCRKYSPLAWYDRQGYHFGILCCVCSTGTVLVMNVVLLIASFAKSGISGGLGVLQSGDCTEIKRTDLLLHLIINLLSTLLLGSSNYCMQCLSSPTRDEVDKAHGKKVWLDIGVPSVRNIRWISRERRILWLILTLSSIPLHLLYNSAVFSTLSAQECAAFAVSHDFQGELPWNLTSFLPNPDIESRGSMLQRDFPTLQKLENKDCIKAYSPMFISSHGDVVVVTNCSRFDAGNGLPYNEASSPQKVPANSTGSYSTIIDLAPDSNTIFYGSMSWACLSDSCVYDTKQLEEDADHLSWRGSTCFVSYCLAQTVAPHCEVQYSAMILIVVTICNLLNTFCISRLIWRSQIQPLVTVGDAIASFLDSPDWTTTDMCLAGKRAFMRKSDWRVQYLNSQSECHSWFKAASAHRWFTTYFPCVAAIIVVVWPLCNFQFQRANLSVSQFGEISADSLIYIHGYNFNVIAVVLLANAPQFLISLLYFGFNGLFTNMLLVKEWTDYAHSRKSLRVTAPTGQQRSTYRLQLPYRYGIPLMVIAALLHWLVSQAIFLVRVQRFDYNGEIDHENELSTCGYSSLGILSSVVIGAFTLLLGLANGFRKYRPGMPLARSCSAAISAACHPPEGDEDAARKKVMWGVVKGRIENEEAGIGHCSFSSLEVSILKKKQVYL